MAQNKNIIHTFSCRRDNCFSVKMVIKVLGYLLLACPWSVPINALIVVVATFENDNSWEWS